MEFGTKVTGIILSFQVLSQPGLQVNSSLPVVVVVMLSHSNSAAIRNRQVNVSEHRDRTWRYASINNQHADSVAGRHNKVTSTSFELLPFSIVLVPHTEPCQFHKLLK